MAKVSEKRKFPRGPLQIPVRCTLHKKSKEGYITDLSPEGCRLYCYSRVPVKVDESVKISLKLKNWQDTMSLKAQIIRVNPFDYHPYKGSKEEINSELGIKFLNVNESQREAIEDYTGMVLRRMKKGQV